MTAIVSHFRDLPSYLGIDPILEGYGKFLDDNPTVNKLHVAAMHFFRAFKTFATMMVLPFHPAVNALLGVVPSFVYFGAIERFCQFKFELWSMAGGMAMYTAMPAIVSICTATAFASIGAFALAMAQLIPLIVYSVTVVIVAHQDVEASIRRGSCCLS